MYFSGDETTERESLADTIAMRTPMAVPMIARLPSKTIYNRVHEWTLDEPFQSSEGVRSISAPHQNSKFEGSDFTDRTPFYPVRVRAICELQHDSFRISGTDQTVQIAGVESAFDYRASSLFTMHLNKVDNSLFYGQGSPETSGKVGAANQRQCQGALYWAAYTGLERCNATSVRPQMEDPYGSVIPSSMYSVFKDFEHTNITGESFYTQIVRRITNAGGDMQSVPWEFWAGDLVMARVSKFLLTDSGVPINQRNEQASTGMGFDHLHTVKLPNGLIVSFRSNRWLDMMSDTFIIDNTGLTLSTPGSPSMPGSVSARTFSGDQTIWGHKPGSVKVCWLRSPGFVRIPTQGDYTRLGVISEFTLEVAHPLDVAGAGNVLA